MYRPNDQIGPYTLIRRLGQGASGIVWLAERRGALLTTQVAIKLPFDEDANLDTISKEAQVWLAATGHPNVLPVIEADMYEGQVVIVSEYASGGTLRDWLEHYGGRAPSIEAAINMVSGILLGLEHLHSKGLVHCDLKPSNVLLQGLTPRITDFGVSRVLRSTVHTKHLSGTPAYMPPEAIDGKLSKQSDLWAAGVILYVMLSGRLPFPQQNMGALMQALKEHDPEALPREVPIDLQRVITRALQKDPMRRYGSAAEMRLALTTASLFVSPPAELPEAAGAGAIAAPNGEDATAGAGENFRQHRSTNPRDGAELVWVPAGEFIMGSEDGERREQPRHRVVVDGFWIYKMAVTVAQYRFFCEETGRSMKHAPPWGWQEQHPVVNVSWEYANAYAQWAGGVVPTEAEWEKAARGTDGRQYPWGQEWDPHKCRNSVGIRNHGVLPVDSFPEGASPYGALNMAGNIWEWTADWYEETYYGFSPERNPGGPFFGTHRVLRGGSWGNDRVEDFRTTTRVVCEPVVRGGSIGFRCIVRGNPPAGE